MKQNLGPEVAGVGGEKKAGIYEIRFYYSFNIN